MPRRRHVQTTLVDNYDGEWGLMSDLPDCYWTAAASRLRRLMRPNDLLLAPHDFLAIFPQTVALHVRKRMLSGAKIQHYAIHKGMLDRTDPELLIDATNLRPVFANEVFVVYSCRGWRLPFWRMHHVQPVLNYLAGVDRTPVSSFATAIVVTTHNRPWALTRTLRSLSGRGHPIIVVDDGSDDFFRAQNQTIALAAGASLIVHPCNVGLAAAMNTGVCYWLAHPDIEWISVFNDDVDVAEAAFITLTDVVRNSPFAKEDTLYTGYCVPDRAGRTESIIAGHQVFLDRIASGPHLHAHQSYWQAVLPVPTTYAGAPKTTGGVFPGQGSESDWWVGSWSPRAAPKRGSHIVVVPGLVVEFATDVSQSTWHNPRH
jgi:hypothetical protein